MPEPGLLFDCRSAAWLRKGSVRVPDIRPASQPHLDLAVAKVTVLHAEHCFGLWHVRGVHVTLVVHCISGFFFKIQLYSKALPRLRKVHEQTHDCCNHGLRLTERLV